MRGRMQRARARIWSAPALLLLPLSLGRRRVRAHGVLPGHDDPANEDNPKIIETVEQYRRRLLEHNVDGLLVLASQTYFEDSGTPRSDDDYGYDGLRQVLASKL